MLNFRCLSYFTLFFLFQLSFASDINSQGNKVFSVVGPYETKDYRHEYEVATIRFFLDKTVSDYGAYELKQLDNRPHNRLLFEMRLNSFPNLVKSFGFSSDLIDDNRIEAISIPIWRGLLGFRTCFISEEVKDAFAQANTMEQLLKYSHGQGQKWVDLEVLQANGFVVSGVASYSSLFKMVAANRFDLFCRGANEVRQEYVQFKDRIGFAYDRTKVFYYHSPHYLYMHKNNRSAIERIRYGIQKAVSDGTFEQHWKRFHSANLKFIALEKRKIIFLKNPLMSNFQSEYEDLMYMPPNLILIR